MRAVTMAAAVMATALGCQAGAPPEPFEGTVVGIADGDTLTILVDRVQRRVRVAEIDAPERGQPFGQKARQSLASLCFRREADAVPVGVDRYGRVVAAVRCRQPGGVDLDAALEQVRQGWAWAEPRYVRRRELVRLEREARERGVGLWAEASPMPPWEWRYQARE